MARASALGRTVLLLGLQNVANVVLHRAIMRLPIRRLRHPLASFPNGPYFRRTLRETGLTASKEWQDHGILFGWLQVRWRDGRYPDWHTNHFAGTRVPDPTLPWWQIPDHDRRVGDIKTIRETSRFDWALAMAQRGASGDAEEWNRLNAWLEDWARENPPYRGANWVCGQEASIRVLHLAMAALIARQATDPLPSLTEYVRVHLKRIELTVRYARAQDNNHGASEAAALFVGGSWLAKQGVSGGAKWERLGRRWLEVWTKRLIADDGGTSQYSVNYHRFVVDLLSMVEVWRRHLALPQMSDDWRKRAAAATRWLSAMIDPTTGDGFNLGANDGSRLLPLTDTDYRDHRPSLQLATVLFADARVLSADGPWNEPLRWLEIPQPSKVAGPNPSERFDASGFMVLRRGVAAAVLRYPRFRYRPSQADALHLDLRVAGQSLLRDAGSFSYNHDLHQYFVGTGSHNTIQFDDRDQMPRLSRFLFGDWIKTLTVDGPHETSDQIRGSASYRDRNGATHRRAVMLFEERLLVEDDIGGFAVKAVMRWRLRPDSWRVEGQTVTNGSDVLAFTSTAPIVRLGVVDGWESRYYLQKTVAPVVEIEITQPGNLTTEYVWR